MADNLAQRWARLMGAQGRPTARPPTADETAATIARYPERAAQGLLEQARTRGGAQTADEARSWITVQLQEAAGFLTRSSIARIATLCDASIPDRFPEDTPDDE